jgi:hypothetical protein
MRMDNMIKQYADARYLTRQTYRSVNQTTKIYKLHAPLDVQNNSEDPNNLRGHKKIRR